MPPEAESVASLERFSSLMRDFKRNLEATGAPLVTVDAAIQALSRAIEDASVPMGRLHASIGRVAASTLIADKQFVLLNRDLEQMKLRSMDAGAGLNTALNALEQLTPTTNALDRALKEGSSAAGTLGLKVEKLGDTLKNVKVPALAGWADKMSALGGGAGGLGTFALGIKKIYNVVKIAIPTVMAMVGVLGGPVTFGIITLTAFLTAGAIAIGQTVARFKEAQGALKAFGGTVAVNETGVGTLTAMFMKNRDAMVVYGVEAEELTKTHASLTASYGLSASSAKRFGLSMMDYAKASTASIVNTLAMGKVTGLTNEQTGAFISSLGVVGEDMSQSSLIFAKVSLAAEQSGINVADFTEALTTLNQANVFARTNMGRTSNTLQMFSDSITESNSALLEGVNRNKMAAAAVRSIADASANLNLPQILAFSGAMDGMAGSMDKAMQKAMGMDRADIFAKALETITAGAAPGEREFVKTMAAMSLGIKDLNTAAAVGAGETTRARRQQATGDAAVRAREDRLLTLQMEANANMGMISKFFTGWTMGKAIEAISRTPVTTPPTVAAGRSGLRSGESSGVR